MPPSALGHTKTGSPTWGNLSDWFTMTRRLSASMSAMTFCTLVGWAQRNAPVAASSAHTMPVLPGMPVTIFRRRPGAIEPLRHSTSPGETSVSTTSRANGWSRSHSSLGMCWKYQAISPVSASSARVELV